MRAASASAALTPANPATRAKTARSKSFHCRAASGPHASEPAPASSDGRASREGGAGSCSPADVSR